MRPFYRSEGPSQESQFGIDLGNPDPSVEFPLGARPSYGNAGFEALELNNVAGNQPGEQMDDKRLIETFGHSEALPKYAASVHRRVTWWSWHSAWNMYAFFLAGIAFAVGHHLYYASLNGQPATDQAKKLRYGTFLAFLTKACLVWAVVGALRQRIWTTLQSKPLPLQGVDALFAIIDDPMALLDWEATKKAKLVILMATVPWLGPVMVTLASQAISVEPTTDLALCPGVKTLNFSLESNEDWRNPTKINGLASWSLSVWNTTKDPELPYKEGTERFDYWTLPSMILKDGAQSAATYTINFTAPGYRCEATSVENDTGSKGLDGRTVPFGPDILLPKGNFSYYVYASGGEYEAEQFVPVLPGGIPIDENYEPLKPPLPKHLGAFRTEPGIWVGYSTITGSGEVPENSSEPGWDGYYTPKIFFCKMYETKYLVEFKHSGGLQSVQVKDRKYVAPILDTTFLPDELATDGTNDNTTAFPETNYVYPSNPSRYRYVAAYHSLGLAFRDLINGTMHSNPIHDAIAQTNAIKTKLVDKRNIYFPVPNLMKAVQGMFEGYSAFFLQRPGTLGGCLGSGPGSNGGRARG